MSIQLIPHQGLRVAEPEYLPLKAYQSGGFYWDGEAQKVIRSILGDFLPPLVQAWPAGQRTGLFQLFAGSQEVLCQSRPASPRNPIPARQLQLLSRCLEDFKRKADSPETTPNNRHIIQQFKLPDFDRDPELYRVSGGFWNRRLHVLWGCERAAESSLPSAAALAKLPSTGAFNIPKQYLRWLAALLALVLLLLLLWWLWSSLHHDVSANQAVPAPVTTAAKPAFSPPAPNSPPGNPGINDARPEPKTGQAVSPPPDNPSPGAPLPAASPNPLPARDGQQNRSVASATPPTAPQPGTPNPSATGLEIDKLGQQLLPDGKVKVQLAVRDPSGSGKTPKVTYWTVDGVTQTGADKMTFELATGTYAIKVYAESPPGNPVVLSAKLKVTEHQEPDVQLDPLK